jgi:hypothetical protein
VLLALLTRPKPVSLHLESLHPHAEDVEGECWGDIQTFLGVALV